MRDGILRLKSSIFMMKRTLLSFGVVISAFFMFNTPALGGKFALRKFENKEEINQLQVAQINVNGVTRSFHYFIPQHTKNKPLPVIIAIHGGGGNGAQMSKSSELIKTARKYNFIVIFPNGNGKKGDGLLTWNANHCCGFAMKNDSDDIRFISQLIDYTNNSLGGDYKRIYLTGISNGAMMTQKAAIALPQKIAAIAPVVGTLFGDEPMPSFGVPALIINGAQDDHIPLNGGPPPKNSFAWDGTPMKPVLYLGQFWAKANKCAPAPKISETNALTIYDFACAPRTNVRHVIVKDGGHEWFGGKAGRPGKPSPSQSFDTNEEIARFFLAHSK